MSISTMVTNLLALSPKIWIGQERLYAGTSIAGRGPNLFSRYKKSHRGLKKLCVYL